MNSVLWAVLLAVFLVIIGYRLFLHPRVVRLGLTAAEMKASLPGDELVPHPRWGFKQAITINAPVEMIWPWLVQMGYQRAGWYSLDGIERLIGAGNFVDGHSSNRIVPELQALQVGDVIKIAEPIPYTVVRLEQNRVMVLHAGVNTATSQPLDFKQPLPPGYLNTSWTFYLEPLEANRTRLIVRFVFDAPATLGNAFAYGIFTEGGAAVMSPRQLTGIRQRAEAFFASHGRA